MADTLPKIGISANVFHEDEERDVYDGRPLLYVEESMVAWVMRGGARPYLIPFALGDEELPVDLGTVMEGMDGLVLHGGADVAPETYGERPRDSEWEGDAVRDAYEIELVEACLDRDLPILGICRGVQLLNVAFGGTLYQDIQTDVDGAIPHKDRDAYDANRHDIEIHPDSHLAAIYGGVDSGTIVSVHHQAIRDLGDRLKIEARSPEDGIVEAVRLQDDDRWVAGVQWHPEFQDPDDDQLLDPQVLLRDFLEAVDARR